MVIIMILIYIDDDGDNGIHMFQNGVPERRMVTYITEFFGLLNTSGSSSLNLGLWCVVNSFSTTKET